MTKKRINRVCCFVFVFVLIGLLNAFSSENHIGITNQAIKEMYGNPNHRFDPVATAEVAKYNVETDKCSDPGGNPFKGPLWNPNLHFDHPNVIEQSCQSIKRYVEKMVKCKTSKECRMYMGRAIHTLQDFFSHSTYSYCKKDKPIGSLVVQKLLNSAFENKELLRNPKSSFQPCPNDPKMIKNCGEITVGTFILFDYGKDRATRVTSDICKKLYRWCLPEHWYSLYKSFTESEYLKYHKNGICFHGSWKDKMLKGINLDTKDTFFSEANEGLFDRTYALAVTHTKLFISSVLDYRLGDETKKLLLG